MRPPAGARRGTLRKALLAGAFLVFVAGGDASAQSRQPLFSGNPVEGIARFGDRIVRSLSGKPAVERRRTKAKAPRRSAGKAPPPPASGAVPLPQRRPDGGTAAAAGVGAAAVAAGTGDAKAEPEETKEPPVEKKALPPAEEAAVAQEGAPSAEAKPDAEKAAEKSVDDAKTGDEKPTGGKPDGLDEPPAGAAASKESETSKPAERAADGAASKGADAASGDPSTASKDESDAVGKTATGAADETDGKAAKDGPGTLENATGVPPTTKALEGNEAETLPVTEIPTPDKRPEAPAGSETSPATSDAPVDDAPNSTEKLKSRIPDITPAASVEAAAAVEDAKLCESELKKRGVEFTVEESIAEGECGVLRPIAIKTLSSGVSVKPDTQLLCRSALALDEWMSDEVTKAAKESFPGDPVVRFDHASTYVCRPRSSETKISEHARGSAIDIADFVFKSGKTIGVEKHEDGTPEATFQKAIRDGACGPFKTVLGPGTDADHATHFHLDIAARRGGYQYCK